MFLDWRESISSSLHCLPTDLHMKQPNYSGRWKLQQHSQVHFAAFSTVSCKKLSLTDLFYQCDHLGFLLEWSFLRKDFDALIWIIDPCILLKSTALYFTDSRTFLKTKNLIVFPFISLDKSRQFLDLSWRFSLLIQSFFFKTHEWWGSCSNTPFSFRIYLVSTATHK